MRTQRIKFRNLKQALAHRVKDAKVYHFSIEGKKIDLNNESEVYVGDISKKVLKAKKWLSAIETMYFERNLRKNASVVEFVISFSTSNVDVEKELKRFLEVLKSQGIIWGGGVVFVHRKNNRVHLHILGSFFYREVIKGKEGKKELKMKKFNLKPGVFKEILKEYLPPKDYEYMLSKVRKRKIGAYPLNVVQKFKKILKSAGIKQEEYELLMRHIRQTLKLKKYQFIELVKEFERIGEPQEVLERYRELLKKIEEKIAEERRRIEEIQRQRWYGQSWKPQRDDDWGPGL